MNFTFKKKWETFINKRRKEKFYHLLTKEILQNKKTIENNSEPQLNLDQRKSIMWCILGKQKIKDKDNNIIDVTSQFIIDYRIDSMETLYSNIIKIAKELYQKLNLQVGKVVLYDGLNKRRTLTLFKTINHVINVFRTLYCYNLLPELQNGGYDLLMVVSEYIAFSFFLDEKCQKLAEERKQKIIDYFGSVPTKINNLIDDFISCIISYA